MPDVLVAGAGLDVLVLERDARPSGQSKALALQPRSIEVLADRGLLAPIEPHVEARLRGWAGRFENRDGAGPRPVYVAWAGGPGLDATLRRWFGRPAVPLTRSVTSATRHPSHG